MSEIPAAAESSSSSTPAPSSTADIVASVVSDAERADTSTSDTGGYTETPTRIDTTNAVEETPAAPTEKELSAAAKFLLKQGHKLKKEDGRDVWLPAKTVEGMLDRYVGEHKTTWEGERTTLAQQAKQYQQHLDELRAAVAGDPRAFLQELAGIDARYKAFLETQAAPQPAVDDPMPPPDYDLGNGNWTYSVEGLKKRDAWVARQMKREVLSELDQRLKPIAERDKAERERVEREQYRDALSARTHQQMQEAQTWPLFGKIAADGTLTDFQQAVLTELQKDTAEAKAAGRPPTLTFEGAYIRASNARLTEDDTKRRERLLKELNAAPTGTALPRQTADGQRSAKPLTTQEIVRREVSKLESGS